jgi:hypothetical protein
MAAAAAILHFAPRGNATAAPALVAVAPAPGAAATEPANTAEPAIEVKPAAEQPPTSIQVALSSNPEGAELFLGETSLGEAPTIAEIPMSGEPVSLTARFPDGTEVVQTIVPDRPLPHIAFTRPSKPAPGSVGLEPKRGTKRTPGGTATTKQPSSSGTIKDRDGTMDPFQ